MTRKDIALTTGGVIASLGLTYLLWRRSQTSQAAAESNPPQESSQAQDGAFLSQYAYFPAMPSISVPSIAGAGGELGSDHYQMPSNEDSLLFMVLRDYAERMGAGGSVAAESVPIIQPIQSRANDVISGIPLTADDARKNLVNSPSIVPVGITTATEANGYNLDLPPTIHFDHVSSYGHIAGPYRIETYRIEGGAAQ